MRIRSSAVHSEPLIVSSPDAPRHVAEAQNDRSPSSFVRSDASERMRELRANLLGRKPLSAGQPMTLVVADPDRHAGTNRLAADLAIASARLGYQVLLVDANIATAGLHQLFRMPNDHGVSDMSLWAGRGEAEIHATAVAGLSLLAAGPPVANPAETIERLALCNRLRQLGGRYDTILIDVTAQPAPEAAAAAAGSDGVILAVRRDRTRIASIRRTIAAFADRQVESLGLVPVA